MVRKDERREKCTNEGGKKVDRYREERKEKCSKAGGKMWAMLKLGKEGCVCW